MAITNYSELQAAVANWLDRADLTARVPEFIALAEAQMNRSLRVRSMVGRSTADLDAAFIALPSTYLEARTLIAADDADAWPVLPLPAETIGELATDGRSGRPQFYAVVGAELRVHPVPDRTYAVELTFYGRIPPLAVATPSNWLLTEAPDAYLYGTLLQAAPYLRDADGAAAWASSYAAALQGLQAADRTKAGRLRTEAGVAFPSSYSIRTDI